MKTQQENAEEIQAKIDALTTRLNKDSIGMMLREQEGYEQTMNETIGEIDKNKEMIENELERTNTQLAWQKLRDSLSKMGKHIILKEEDAGDANTTSANSPRTLKEEYED